MSVAIGDVNGDGHPDVVVANICQSSTDCDTGGVSVLLGNGDGTFQAPVSYGSGGFFGSSVAIADLNGDVRPDLVVASACPIGACSAGGTGVVSVLLGNGDGTFQAAVPYSTGGFDTVSAVVADVNGDGKPDLVVSHHYQNGDLSDGGVSVLLGNGDGTFQAAVGYGAGPGDAEFVAVADVNGDGKPDLAVANCSVNYYCNGRGSVSVLVGNGDGTFQAPVRQSSGGKVAMSVAIADVNGDGRPDLLVASLCAKGCINRPNGTIGALLNDLYVTTITKLASSPNPSNVNQSVAFTATVSSKGSVPNGSTITFYNGATKIGTSTTTNGVATLATSFSSAGKYTIEASYAGDAFHQESSGTVKQVVNP
jgi:hypothetical protein